jgi:uncharacterized protein (TIGR02001 family)
LWLLMCAGACRAQAAGSVAVVSDYRYRGISLSDGEPALQLQLDRDFASGAYAGLMLSSVRVYDTAGMQWLPYAGIVRERSGLRWEAGVQYHGFTVRGLDFVQWFAGVGGERVQARLHYAPRYFGAIPAWYLEVDAQQRLSERWRLLGHAGVLRVGGHEDDADEDRLRSDLRIGVAAAWRAVDVQLAWVHACCAEDYRGGHGYPGPDRQAWVLQLAHRW